MEKTKKPAAPKTAESPNETVVITRVFDAPRDRVFQAWAEPERLMRWWGPHDFTPMVCKMDFRPGGAHLKGMRSPEGHEYWNAGVYREIAAPERIVYTEFFSDAEGHIVSPATHGLSGEWTGKMLVSLNFAQEGEKTKLTLEHDLGSAPPEVGDMCRQGWSQTLDKLAEELA